MGLCSQGEAANSFHGAEVCVIIAGSPGTEPSVAPEYLILGVVIQGKSHCTE